MELETVKGIVRDAAAEIAVGILLRYSKLNELTAAQQIQLDADARSVAEVVIIDAFQPFLVEEDEY